MFNINDRAMFNDVSGLGSRSDPDELFSDDGDASVGVESSAAESKATRAAEEGTDLDQRRRKAPRPRTARSTPRKETVSKRTKTSASSKTLKKRQTKVSV